MKNKTLVALVAGIVILSGCTQTPNSTSNNGSDSNQAEINQAFSLMYEDEEIFQDSKEIAETNNSFKTKALLNTDINIGTDIVADINNLNFNLNNTLSTNVLTEIGRTDFTVKTSNVAKVNNNDGTEISAIKIQFLNNNTNKAKSNTYMMTNLNNGSYRINQNIDVSFNGYLKNTSRMMQMDSNNQITLNTTSKATLNSGSEVEYSEQRTGNTGSGSLKIKESNGEIHEYTFNTSVDNTSKLTIDAKNTTDNVQVKISEKSENSISSTIVNNGNSNTSDLKTDIASETYVESN